MSQKNPTDLEIDRFAEAIVLQGKTKTDAFRAAFPDSKAKPEGAQVAATRMSALAKVRLRIDQLNQQSREEFQKHFGATIEWKTKMLMKAVELGYSFRVDDKGNEIPNGIGAAVSAIAEMNRMSGDHAPSKQEHTGKDGGPIRSEVIEWVLEPVSANPNK